MMAAASTQTEFGEVLKSALALCQDDQARLCSLLQRLTGAPAPLPLPEGGTEVQLAPQRTAQEWLGQIQNEAPWSQLALLDEALEAEDAPDERAVLERARAHLLRAHPPLALRRAVTELASRSPVAMCVGILGLLVGVVGIGRQLLRILF
jgi:hypothetical protein